VSRGLLRAGIGLVILGVSVPVSGLDLADDLIGLVLLAVAGRDLGSRPLLVTATLAALVDLVEFGGAVSILVDGSHRWWYAAAGTGGVLQSLVIVTAAYAVGRACGRRPTRAWAAAALAYVALALVRAALLVGPAAGTATAGRALGVAGPLLTAGALVAGIVVLVARERTFPPFPADPRPRP